MALTLHLADLREGLRTPEPQRDGLWAGQRCKDSSAILEDVWEEMTDPYEVSDEVLPLLRVAEAAVRAVPVDRGPWAEKTPCFANNIKARIRDLEEYVRRGTKGSSAKANCASAPANSVRP
jgi:hypothetical protein